MKFFKQIIPLPHPRFIMQYKLKKKEEYIDRYLRELAVVTDSYRVGNSNRELSIVSGI